MTTVARVEPDSLYPEKELAALVEHARGEGAVVSFVGLARDRSASGGTVVALHLEHHPILTAKSLQEIADEAIRRFDVSHVRIVHRCGRMEPGAAIVFAGAASRHRRAAFEAADYLMDRLKTEAIFWKREEGSGESRWIEPTKADYADRNRWE